LALSARISFTECGIAGVASLIQLSYQSRISARQCGIGLGRFVDDVPEPLAHVDAVVHAVQVDLREHGAAAVLADVAS
jgi:hypothetical protein